MATRKLLRTCIVCSKKQMIELRYGKFRSERCHICELKSRKGSLSPLWKGGFYKKSNYILVWIDRSSQYHPMADKDSYVREHRLVMAQSLGRCLLPKEIVHHINGNKSDNRLENLELISSANHVLKTKLCQQCGLHKEIRLLGWQIKQQSEQIRELTSKLMGIL